MNNSFLKSLSLYLGLSLLTWSGVRAATVEQLQVEYQDTPLGIDVDQPRFNWQMHANDDQRGVRQLAYQIIVEDETRKKVWDSGKVNSAKSLAIDYAGAPLQASTRYSWRLQVWDQDNELLSNASWFETGLMSRDAKSPGWSGARWIGGGDEDLVLQAHYLSVFRLEYVLTLDQKSNAHKAAFVFGANDVRLQNDNLNLLGMRTRKDESYVALELDIADLENGGQAQLHIYRVGYSGDDKPEIPLKSFKIPREWIHAANKYEPHQFYLESVFGILQIYLEKKQEKHKLTVSADPPSQGGGLNLNPYGTGGDFICFPMLGDIGFKMDKGQKAAFSNVKIRHYRSPSNVIFSEELDSGSSYTGIFQQPGNKATSINENAYVVDGGPSGALVIADPSRNAAPMLRTTFTPEAKAVRKARLYVTARGIYELYLNGKRVGTDYFNPGLTQYNKTQFYQTYDVTNDIDPGQPNALGAWLSEGWWSGNITFRGENWNYFGDRQSLLAKLVISYEDGTEKVLVSNDRDWKMYAEGPVRYGSFFQGEYYDATREAAIDDWATPAYDDSAWKVAVAVPLQGNAVIGTFRDFIGREIPLFYDNQKLIGQVGENVKIVSTIMAKSVEEVRPGVFVYDMGQNMVGFPNINIQNGAKGKEILLRYAEVRYPQLEAYKDHQGMIMMENIRGALTHDRYLLKGGEETIQPRFTFHGYRFLEITGLDQALPLGSVKGQVLSSVHHLASRYESSNALVNKLWENITWSLRGNFLSIPTDTPARNERMGWNGDINVFARAASYLAPADLFLRRHLLAMRDMQGADGRFSDVAPVGNGFGGTLWGSAGIIIPWELYQQYGDMQSLKEHYGAMKRYLEFLDTKIDQESGLLTEGPLGDWLSPENGKNDNTMLWTAYHLRDLEIMSNIATLLRKENDAAAFQKRYEERRRFFNSTYVNSGDHTTIHSGMAMGFRGPGKFDPALKGKAVDTQASYAIPLAFKVFDEAHHAAAVQHLVKTIQRTNTDDGGVQRPEYSLMTGFIGTASIGEALSENGLDEVAYRLLQQETYPSWLYPVINGATTIWERLNSYTIEEGFGGNNSMNSFNHYAFGAVAAWMYNYSLGIQRDPEEPGFHHFVLKPTPDPTEKMSWAKGHYDSMYGRIESEWVVQGDELHYQCRVPPNTSATLHLPADSRSKIRESGKQLKKAKGLRYLSENGERIILELQSGHYDFVVKKKG